MKNLESDVIKDGAPQAPGTAENEARSAAAQAETEPTEAADADGTDGPDPAERGRGPYRARGSHEKHPMTHGRRAFKMLYWATWFVLIPALLAYVVISMLTPASGIERSGALGWLQLIAREQPVPAGIVLFTLFEMALWAWRLHLPLADYAHPPSRSDLPDTMRAPFERARGLLEEAEAIFTKNRTAIVRDLSASERENVRAHLEALEDAMDATPFDEERFVEALVNADREVDARLGRWRKSEAREYIESILVAIAVAMALRAFVVEAFKIPSGSMIPTLQVGDHIFVNKFSYGPAIPYTHARVWTRMPPDRGDVMVFAFPEHPEQDFIKRVIAVPGDKLEARSGHPVINGWEVPSCFVGVYSYTEADSPMPHHEGDLYVEFLEDEAYLTLFDHAAGGFPEYQGPFFVKPGEVYVMGDNRNNSHDSRMWWGGQGGGVPFENIKGRALFVWLSVGENGIDWSRLGAPVMGHPRLPAMMKSLEPALDKCLRERPSIDKTTPPRGK